MNSRKMTQIVILTIITALLLTFTACSHIEDTNGDNTALVTIDLDKLSGTSLSATTNGVSSKSARNNITLVDMYEDIDLDTLEMSGGTTSGIQNIIATEVKAGETLSIYVESRVDEGNLQVILLSEDNEVVYAFETGTEDVAEVTVEETTTFFVRTGMESYSGTLYVERMILE